MFVLYAVMTYDRGIGTREAGSGNVCILWANPRARPAGRLHSIYVALSCKLEKGRSACQIRGFAYTASMWLSAVSLKKADPPARSAGLTRGSA